MYSLRFISLELIYQKTQYGLLIDYLQNNLLSYIFFTDCEKNLEVRIAPKLTKTRINRSSSIARLVIRFPSKNLYQNSITSK